MHKRARDFLRAGRAPAAPGGNCHFSLHSKAVANHWLATQEQLGRPPILKQNLCPLALALVISESLGSGRAFIPHSVNVPPKQGAGSNLLAKKQRQPGAASSPASIATFASFAVNLAATSCIEHEFIPTTRDTLNLCHLDRPRRERTRLRRSGEIPRIFLPPC